MYERSVCCAFITRDILHNVIDFCSDIISFDDCWIDSLDISGGDINSGIYTLVCTEAVAYCHRTCVDNAMDNRDNDFLYGIALSTNSGNGALMFEITVLQFVLFLMIFLRVSAFIIVAPIFGHQAVPVQVKVSIALFVSYVMMPLFSSQAIQFDLHYLALIIMPLKEVVVGLLLGFMLNLVFIGFQYAGELMAYTIGLSMAQMYDPENSQQTPVLSQILYLFSLLLFLTINGHHYIFESLTLLFKNLPIGEFVITESLVQKMVELTGLLFVVAVKIAAPILIAGFLTYFGLAVLARVMPQANILIVGFPITISVGMLILVSTVPLFAVVFKKLLLVFETRITEIIVGF